MVTEVETKQFVRLRADNLLQIDFVNDISARYKDVIVTENDFLIDNIGNILSNKISAVIGRDNPKDIFDIYLICYFYSFSWKEILDSAHEKAGFSSEDLVIRLKSFPRELFSSINCIDDKFLSNFDVEFPMLIEEIIRIADHKAIGEE